MDCRVSLIIVAPQVDVPDVDAVGRATVTMQAVVLATSPKSQHLCHQMGAL